jgi:hypothetical protein
MNAAAHHMPGEPNAIQRDKIASLLAHDVRRGKLNEAGVLRKIFRIKDDAKREDMHARFLKFMGVNN